MCPTNNKRSVADAETKIIKPRKIRKIKTSNPNQETNEKSQSKTSLVMNTLESNAQEALNANPDLRAKSVSVAETFQSTINKVANDIKELRMKRKNNNKNELFENDGNNNNKVADIDADDMQIDQSKQSVDAALSNKPIVTSTKTISCEIGIQHKSERRSQPNKMLNKKLNTLKIPPTMRVLKSLQ